MHGGAPVLVVDDDPMIRSSISDILHLQGYPVATASNGAEALALVEQSIPSLVLLDMRMPVLDGWGFAGALSQRRIEVPIVVVTAAQDAEDWAREVAAEGFLAKPFELTDLLEVVERHRAEGRPGN
ncbi:MAG: response regulator [Candidatus Limnocylindria bacterium]